MTVKLELSVMVRRKTVCWRLDRIGGVLKGDKNITYCEMAGLRPQRLYFSLFIFL